MRLKKLYIAGFLGIREASIDITSPVALLCGANGAGKSSVRDALRLVLTADLSRVHLKKDAGQLITDGADSAIVQVVTADGEDYRVSITRAGKITDSQRGHDQDPRLPYVLDGQRLASLSETERRAFLFGAMGLQTTHSAIAARLVSKGLSEPRVKRIEPLLRAGFDAACKDAKERASQARGAWKAITGENYGAIKARTWSADKPSCNAVKMQQAMDDLRSLNAELNDAQRELGAIEADIKRVHAARVRMADLQPVADLLARRREKLARDRAELAGWDEKLRNSEAAAGGAPRVGLLHDLAASLKWALSKIEGTSLFAGCDQEQAAVSALEHYEQQHGSLDAAEGDPEVLASLPGIRASHALLASAVGNAERDVRASEAAQAELSMLAEQVAAPLASPEPAHTKVADLRKRQGMLAAEVDAFSKAKAAADAAGEKTMKAAGAHADVAAWDAIADALAPDGIQAEMLAEAIGPFNARLQQSAIDTDWPQVVVQPDMTITAGGRAYGLLSESEQWRCDAMLAEAIAFVTDLRLLVLDRMDVLDATGRGQLLGWLDALASTGEVDTVIVLATLKALPAGLPETMSTYWIDAGRCGVPAAELAAA